MVIYNYKGGIKYQKTSIQQRHVPTRPHKMLLLMIVMAINKPNGRYGHIHFLWMS